MGCLEFGPAQTGSCCGGKTTAFTSCGCGKITTTIGTRTKPPLIILLRARPRTLPEIQRFGLCSIAAGAWLHCPIPHFDGSRLIKILRKLWGWMQTLMKPGLAWLTSSAVNCRTSGRQFYKKTRDELNNYWSRYWIEATQRTGWQKLILN